MMRALRRSLLVASLFTTLVPTAAHAQSAADTAAARDLFVEGAKLAQDEHYAEARDHYLRSFRLKRAALTLYSLGVVEKKMGLLVESTEHFRAFLLEPSEPRSKPYEQPSRDAIAEMAPRISKVKVNVVPVEAKGVVVKVDGEAIPEAARIIAREVNPGKHHIEVLAAEFQTETKDIETTAGGLETVVITLSKPAPNTNPTVTVPPMTATGPTAPKNLGLGLAIGGGAVFATGVVIGLVGVSQASGAKTKDGSDAKSAKTKALVGDVLGGVGLVAGGVGAYLLLFPSKPDSASVGIGPGTATFRATF